MPQRYENGSGATALAQNAMNRLGEGYGWIEGTGVSLGGSTTEIELQVSAGTVQHSGSFVDVAQQSVTLFAGHPQNPRKDVVYVDYEGTAKVRAGEAAAPKPEQKRRDQTFVPAPPDGSAIDGIPLFEVWVPAGAESAGDLSPEDLIDRRVAVGTGGGIIPVREADPPDAELATTQWWYNTTVGELRVFFEDVREVHTLDTTLERSLSGAEELIVEDFDRDIRSTWRGGHSEYELNPNSYEGEFAHGWTSATDTHDYTLPGDGLPRYASPGDQISLAVFIGPGHEYTYLGFGKEDDVYGEEYRVQVDSRGRFELREADSISGGPKVDETAATVNSGSWHIIDVTYDGGGTGVHPCQLWSTDSEGRNDLLAELDSPPQTTTYRGRGLSIGGAGHFRVDRLAIRPG